MIQALYYNLLKLLSWFLGSLDGPVQALIVFVIIDLFMSLLLAYINKDFKTYINKKIVCKKVCLFLVVGLSHIVDVYLVDFMNGFRTITILFYIVCEGIEILDKIIKTGLPVPKPLITFLKKIKSEDSN